MIPQNKIHTLWLPATDFLSEEYAEEYKSPVTKEQKNHVKERPISLLLAANTNILDCEKLHFKLRSIQLTDILFNSIPYLYL